MKSVQEPPQRQRLVVFLDGTWNNRDDCTNVLNIYNLVPEGKMADGLVQRKNYDEGVGTGVLDSVSGGAFGDGLELNVREAYDWLVEHFRDGHDAEGKYWADEIYIFGFSRGAYTARSLAGFIARCGLLRRGGPLTVNQLWEGYGELERQKQEQGEGFWDRVLSVRKFRQLEELLRDPWHGGALLKPDSYNETECLLVQWSRRVRITFIGVFDTVGALGLDALAIPGLRSKAGQVHNMRPSSIILNFRHALAIDENRGGFQHTPLVDFIPHAGRKESRPGLEQRWFIGAHSNVGGGYDNNVAAQKPLLWMLEEAAGVGLVTAKPEPAPCRPTANHLPGDPPILSPGLRDSFAEFAWPIWTFVLRAKRNFRPIAPPDDVRAKKDAVDLPLELPEGTKLPAGFALRSQEDVDASVWQFAASDPSYAPPQLVEYARRFRHQKEEMQQVALRAVLHDWPAPEGGGAGWITLWALLAGIGLMVVDGLFLLFPGAISDIDWIAAGLVTFLAVVVDWAESRLNVRLAFDRASVWKRATTDAIFWTRSILTVFFVVGALGTASFLFSAGWNSGDEHLIDALWRVLEVGHRGGLLLVLALLVVAITMLLDMGLGPVQNGTRVEVDDERRLRHLLQVLGWLASAALLGALVVLFGRSAWNLCSQAGWAPQEIPAFHEGTLAPGIAFAGRYLFLLISLAYLLRSFAWVGEPMARVNLDITKLMFLRSGSAVKKLLERWQALLECRWEKDGAGESERQESARRAVRSAVGESLWRDTIGFIPVYTFVLGYGMFFAARELQITDLSTPLGPLPLWLVIALVGALADLSENALHGSYLGRRGPFPTVGTFRVYLALLATALKFLAFFAGVFFSLVSLYWGGWKILVENEGSGWRGALAGVVVLIALAIFATSAWAALEAWLKREGKSLG